MFKSKANKKLTQNAIAYFMMATTLVSGIANAYNPSHDALNIDDFQDAENLIIENKEPLDLTFIKHEIESLSYLIDHSTGEEVPLNQVLKYGGVFNDPLNPEEIIFISVDGRNDVSDNQFKDKKDYDVILDKLSFIKKLGEGEGEGAPTGAYISYVNKDDIDNADLIDLIFM